MTHTFLFVDNTTVYFLKDVLNQKKRHLMNDQIQHFHVPQYKSLSVEKILEFIADLPDIADFLPDDQDLVKTPKQWIVNVCAAVVGEPFKRWVGEQVEERNDHMAEKRSMMIAMDPVMAQKFANSTHISRKFLSAPSSDPQLCLCSRQGHQRQHVEDVQQAAPHHGGDQGRQGGQAQEGAGRGVERPPDPGHAGADSATPREHEDGPAGD